MHRKWKVVGHRGFAARYPENTLAGFAAAIALGVDAIELDVHLSKDGVPLVLHDQGLNRTSGHPASVHQLAFADLQKISCHYPEKFGERFYPLPLQALAQVSEIFQYWGGSVFIELKRKSMDILGREEFLQKVLDASQLLGAQAGGSERRKLISFDWQLLALAKKHCKEIPIGWCLENFDEETEDLATQLDPDMLIAKPSLIGEAQLWSGAWDWFIYDIETAQQAQEWHARGAAWIEADDPLGVSAERAID